MNGLPYAIYATTADITNREGAIEFIEENKNNLCEVVQQFLYDGEAGKGLRK
jgi:hypothetical protein